MRPLLLALLITLLPLELAAASAEQQGLALFTTADQRDSGWVDGRAELEMILRNAQGEESHRSLRIDTLEVAGDGDKSLTVFDAPRDIKGTAFLSYTHALAADDQWLYLPALKRVKRIASANKSGPFVGSEFAYEDITSQEVEKFIDDLPSVAIHFIHLVIPIFSESKCSGSGQLQGKKHTTIHI